MVASRRACTRCQYTSVDEGAAAAIGAPVAVSGVALAGGYAFGSILRCKHETQVRERMESSLQVKLIIFGIVLAIGWLWLIVDSNRLMRRRRAGERIGVSWSRRTLVMCCYLGCFVGSVVLVLLYEGFTRTRIVAVLLLQEDAFETADLRYGLVVVYLLFALGVLYPQSRLK